ncbi:MAG: aspartate kinase [Actinomycetota bacterium]|nr:aspartate kinase [Actinomycetota bacterium]MDK1016310.1 aspartate kinase [Actinomycetota bacterium]MDK1027580.1 aspartate kinase [Actinomycetota bacterium]MDK1095910.1 aspartate kinase [Actinomycetota bacterium]MDK1102088.1 aspartate kinase [Actinomycetota bacterium]
MALVVQKYGGTSVADADRICSVARRIVDTYSEPNDVVAVVSAMGTGTDDLIALAEAVSDRSHPREMDMLLTAGERVTMALVAMAIQDLGVPATSLTGSQAGILTTGRHGRAEIVEIRANRVREGLDEGKVVIVAGFQGVDPDSKDVTTLGRGGSDATAVALAAALSADRCEIYTDVDGVFTADPRVVPGALKIDEVSFEEMLELASGGAGVLMPRSVEFGRRFGIPIHVRSSFHDGEGTWVKEETMEQAVVRGIAHDISEAKLTVYRVPDTPGVAASLFEPLADAGVTIDMIVQNVSQEGSTDISFTVPLAMLDVAEEVTKTVAEDVNAGGVSTDREIAKVSIVGIGMKTESGIASRMFRILADHDINIQMISTSPIRISCVIAEDRVSEAVSALHAGLELDGEALQ